MDKETITLIATIVTAIGALVAAGATVVYTIFTRRLWTETKRQAKTAVSQAETATYQAETANRQAIIAQQMLEAAHRPWLSVELIPDVGTGPGAVYFASVLRNHGNVPGTVTKKTMRTAWDGKTWAQGDPHEPTVNPSNLCIFPGQLDELKWGIDEPSRTPWPKRGQLRFQLEITYRGAFEERIYHTRIEASYPVPEGRITSRSGTPMQIANEEAT
jgi:hypothetical protein